MEWHSAATCRRRRDFTRSVSGHRSVGNGVGAAFYWLAPSGPLKGPPPACIRQLEQPTNRSDVLGMPKCRVSTAVVQRFCKPKVGGSIPSPGTSFPWACPNQICPARTFSIRDNPEYFTNHREPPPDPVTAQERDAPWGRGLRGLLACRPGGGKESGARDDRRNGEGSRRLSAQPLTRLPAAKADSRLSNSSSASRTSASRRWKA